MGFDPIAAKFNAEDVPTRTGRRWRGVIVNRILTGNGLPAGRHDARASHVIPWYHGPIRRGFG
jgi:hypothetical protein